MIESMSVRFHFGAWEVLVYQYAGPPGAAFPTPPVKFTAFSGSLEQCMEFASHRAGMPLEIPLTQPQA
jgi:hypothetical protein